MNKEDKKITIKMSLKGGVRSYGSVDGVRRKPPPPEIAISKVREIMTYSQKYFSSRTYWNSYSKGVDIKHISEKYYWRHTYLLMLLSFDLFKRVFLTLISIAKLTFLKNFPKNCR